MAAVQGLPKVLIRYANVHLANPNIDLLQYDEPKVKKASYDNSDIGAMHLCFEVDDLDAVYQRMRDAAWISRARRSPSSPRTSWRRASAPRSPISTTPTAPI